MKPATVLSAAALALAFAAAPLEAATLRFSSQGDIVTIDPHAQNEGFTNAFLDGIYEPLDKDRFAARHETGGIERLREQRALPDEKHVSRGVHRPRIGVEQACGLWRIDRPDPDRRCRRLDPEKKMTAVGQECRIRV